MLPNIVTFGALMQALAATGQIVAGLKLLAQAEAYVSSPHSDDDWYPIFRTLLEACRAAGDSGRASQVQEAMDRRGLVTLVLPLATTLMKGSEQQYENAVTGWGDAEAEELWLALRKQTAYMPQLQALPWTFAQSSTRQQQEQSLKLHAEKKALAMLLVCSEAELHVVINFHACMDCHELFKKSSLLLHHTIQLRQPRMVHAVIAGCCSCMTSGGGKQGSHQQLNQFFYDKD